MATDSPKEPESSGLNAGAMIEEQFQAGRDSGVRRLCDLRGPSANPTSEDINHLVYDTLIKLCVAVGRPADPSLEEVYRERR